MGLKDVIVIAVIAVLLFLAVRSVALGKADACAGCGSKGTCSGHCAATDDMLRRAERALNKK